MSLTALGSKSNEHRRIPKFVRTGTLELGSGPARLLPREGQDVGWPAHIRRLVLAPLGTIDRSDVHAPLGVALPDDGLTTTSTLALAAFLNSSVMLGAVKTPTLIMVAIYVLLSS